MYPFLLPLIQLSTDVSQVIDAILVYFRCSVLSKFPTQHIESIILLKMALRLLNKFNKKIILLHN